MVEHALLGLRWQIMEARFILQRTLLLGERQITVSIHPLRKMFLISTRVGGVLRLAVWCRGSSG